MKYKVGDIIFKEDPIIINGQKPVISLVVSNTGDRSIQVCSHYHFFEVNLALRFDREKALGMRLDIPSGTALRFEPGEEQTVQLVPYGGEQRVIGFLGCTMGQVTDTIVRAAALERMANLEKGGAE